MHAPPGPGDVRHCTADTTRLAGVLGIRPQASLAEELADYWSWFDQAALVP